MYAADDKLPESTGDKLPESTGDELPESTGEDDSTLLGKLSWTALREVAPLGCLDSSGEQSYIKTARDTCLGISVYSAGEC